ncbi:MAG: hypothetical protein NXH75_17760, partial [Halobacteriovoraceae bacterium]|nr:hypothetical protein [Halobacteriovoraceae bacterium]
MKMVLIILSLLSIQSFASFPEFFGTSPTTSAIGNQANGNIEDPANNYYIPSLIAWAETLNISANVSATTHSFTPIKGVVTGNATTGESGTTTTTGDVNTNYEDSFNSSVHLVLPLRYKALGALGISFFSPFGRLAETNSGSPNLPEYSLYRARYKRTQLHFNLGVPLSENLALSVGAHLGFQVAARVNTQVSLSNNYGSNGSAKTKIDPSLGAILSLVYRSGKDLSYFTFQQEMKSNLEAVATGDISDPPLTLINVGLESMIYYDPHILRVGQTLNFDFYELFFSLEYQMWENYEPPLIRVSNLGGTVKASDRFERLNLRNVIVPKLGLLIPITEELRLRGGLSYRQSPFDSDFGGAGNTIDTNTYVATGGLTYDIKLFNKEIQLGASLQYHKLEDKTVTKTTGQ